MLAALIVALQVGSLAEPVRTAAVPATSVVRGRVVSADTGAPLKDATVRLMPILNGPQQRFPESRAALTDADGRWELRDVPAGRYTATAGKPAFVNEMWRAAGPPRGNGRLDLAAGQTVEQIDFSLARGAVVTGRVVDEFGDPAAGVQVAMMQAHGGQAPMYAATNSTTNDLGEFRIFGVEPGEYAVLAKWNRFGGDPFSPDHTGYAPTYFPGTTAAGEAQRFKIAAGQTIANVNIPLTPTTTARVEGVVIDSGGKPATVNLTLAETGTNGSMVSFRGASTRPDGTFVFTGVVPGDYTLRTANRQGAKEFGAIDLTVGDEDLTNVQLVTAAPPIVSGRVVFVGAPSPPRQAASMTVWANPMGNSVGGGFSPARVADDLTFHVEAIPGRIRLFVNAPPGWMLRSIKRHNQELAEELELKPGERLDDVELEYTNKIATIAGTVVTGRNEPAGGVQILVFPQDKERWTSRYRGSGRTEADGTFRVTGLAPGSYYVAAVDRVEPGLGDTALLERAAADATAVTIGEGETKTVTLKK